MDKIEQHVDDLSYQVIGCALEVHRTLGPRLLESVYEEALCIELENKGIPHERQKPVGIVYKGRSIGEARLDVVVNNLVIVELKAVERLMPIHTAQTITYLKITGIKLGMLINFNVSTLKNGIKRVVL